MDSRERRIINVFLFFLCLMVPIVIVSAQEGNFASVPDGFGDIRLGSGREAVVQSLIQDPSFVYEGEPDVSMLDPDDSLSLECPGSGFVEWGYFQFYQNRLYVITVVIDDSKLDYFTLYSTLKDKYGEPTGFSPSRAVWESNDYRMSLEVPLTLKYVSKPLFSEYLDEGQAEESFQQMLREDFLNGL